MNREAYSSSSKAKTKLRKQKFNATVHLWIGDNTDHRQNSFSPEAAVLGCETYCQAGQTS